MNYKNRAENAIAQGALTNSKHWNAHVKGVYPTHIKNSTGCHLIDTNGKSYVDFICGLGTNLLGYGHPLVENEVEKYRHQGKSPSFPHILEIEVAEKLKQVFPWVQRWKFLKSGSEACSAAIKMARAHSNKKEKKQVISEGYHGWHDSFISLEKPAKGVDGHFNLVKKADKNVLYNQIDCAYITEPVLVSNSESRIIEMGQVKRECEQENITLIHDEVITGFRYKSQSVSKHHNLEPDLIVIGKAMANGYPLAAVGGPASIMDNDYFVSSTYAGELSSLAACGAVIDIVRTKPEFHIDRLWEAGAKFRKEFNEVSMELGFQIDGYATRGVFNGDPLAIAIFFQQACIAGILFGKSWFISHSHLPMLDVTLDSCKLIMEKMRVEKPQLIGELPQSPFSMRNRK